MLARPMIPRALKNACLVRNDMWTISEDQLLDSAKLDGRLMKTTFLKISVATAFPYKAFEAAPANSVSLKVGVGKNAKSAYEAQRAKKGEGERSPLSKSVMVCGRYGQFVNRWVESGRQQMLVIENAGTVVHRKKAGTKGGDAAYMIELQDVKKKVGDQIEQIINLATTSVGGPVLQWVKGSDNEPVLRPFVTNMRANVFSGSAATTETFPDGAKWALQRLKQLASTDRAIDYAMKEVSKPALAAALRVTNKGTMKKRKDSPSPKRRSRSISNITISLSPSRSPSRGTSRSPLRRASCSLSRVASRSPLRRTSRSLSRSAYRSPSCATSHSLFRDASGNPSRSRSRNMRRRSRSSSGSPLRGLRGSFCSPSRGASRSPFRRASRSPLRRASCNPSRAASHSPLGATSRSLLRDASGNPSRSLSRNMRRRSRSSSGSPLSGSSRKRRHSKSDHTSPKKPKRPRMKSAVSPPTSSPRHSPQQSPKSVHGPSQRQFLESEEVRIVDYSESD